jgi:hypothetical protein
LAGGKDFADIFPQQRLAAGQLNPAASGLGQDVDDFEHAPGGQIGLAVAAKAAVGAPVLAPVGDAPSDQKGQGSIENPGRKKSPSHADFIAQGHGV